MTMINPYGIGAGRAISEQYEDDTDKERNQTRRRVNAVQLAEQERLKARLQGRTLEYSATDEVQRIAESDQAELYSHKPQPQELKDFAALPSEEAVTQPAQAARYPSQLQGETKRANRPVSSKSTADRAVDAPDARSQSALLGSVLYDLQTNPVRLTSERVLHSLGSLRDSLRSSSKVEISTEDREGLQGYLEFVEGYFESAPKRTAHSEKIATLMSEIRLQLDFATDPSQAGALQRTALAASSQRPVEATRTIATGDSRKALRKDRSASDDDETFHEIVASEANPPGSPANNAAVSGGSSSKSSLSKDSNRRRNETLVSVTMRSV